MTRLAAISIVAALTLAAPSASAEVKYVPAGSSPWCAKHNNEGCIWTMFETDTDIDDAALSGVTIFIDGNEYKVDADAKMRAMTEYFIRSMT